MSKAKQGDTVRVHYTGKLDDGSVFDSSEGRSPLEFTVGTGQVISGFDDVVDGLEVGASATTRIEPDKAYGPSRPELVQAVERKHFPADADPQIGQQFQLMSPDGHPITVKVTETSETTVTLDANHPLAGQALTFDVTLVEIV